MQLHSPTAGSTRLAQLLAAGLVDSYGMTMGWTVFCLLAHAEGGLVALGVYNAAMLVGVSLSAPATAWLSRRLRAATMLRATAGLEAVLRVGSFLLLLAGAPPALLAAVVVVMSLAGYTSYAAMRAEVSLASRPGRAGATMTSYVVALTAIDAVGVATAALLPGEPPGSAAGLLAGVVAFYGASQLPTWLVASGARAPGPAPRRPAAPQGSGAGLPLLGGSLVMLLGSGPPLLAVGLTSQLHGPRWVAASALAFTAGALLAPALVALLERRRVPIGTAWPALGAGMLLGWVLAPAHVAALVAAQVASGLCVAAFEGGMDAHLAATAAGGNLTARLAASAATRALGSATAVAALPALAGTGSIDVYSAAAGAVFLAAGVVLGRPPLTRARPASRPVPW